MLVIIITYLISFSSIHEMEYRKHINTVHWTQVSLKKHPYKILKAKNKGMLKTYYGYLPYWVDTTYYQYFQMELLTHIAYFSIGINPSSGGLGSIPNASNFNQIRDYAHLRGVKVHMTFTIFGSSYVSDFLNNSYARQNAIQNIVNFVNDYGCDGVNIDFEFVTSSVKDSFNKFIYDLSSALWNDSDGRKELYIAMPAVPEWYTGYDYPYLAMHSDGLFIMAYDFHYSGSSYAGPVSPCVPSSFWGEYSVAKTIGSYKNYGVPGSKMVLGIPYYGYDWPTSSENIGSSTTGSGSAVIYYYAFQHANSYGRLWDTYSLTPWYRYNSSGWHQCWYDDSVSIGIKLNMVNDSGLQGAGCWALGYDRYYNHLWNTIKKALWIEVPTRHWTVEVNTYLLNVREGPTTDYKIIGQAGLGERFVAYDYYNNNGIIWYKVYFPSGSGPSYAWMAGGDGINSQYLKGSTKNKLVKIKANLLNVREGPGTSYSIITQVAKGEVFVADSISGNWARIFLPLGDTSRGWLSLSYADEINNPEDYNSYDCTLRGVYYQDTVDAQDTFSVRIKIKNTGFAPFDTLVHLIGNGRSPFYNPSTWQDTTHARLIGFSGLPGQTFYSYAVFKAPPLGFEKERVSDTFRFERNGTVFGPQIVISVNLRALIGEKSKSSPLNNVQEGSVLFKDHLDLNFPKSNFEFFIYNAAGQKIMHRKFWNAKKITIGKELPPGIYILIIKSKNKSIRRKIIKIE